MGAPQREAAGPAEKRRKAQHKLNSLKNPEPIPCRGAPPTPLPRHRRSHAREPVTPQPSETSGIPTTPATFPGPKGRKAPKARHGSSGGTAWERRKAPQGCAVRHGTEVLESAAEICREARQKIAARRSPVEFPEKTRTHPLPWAPPTPLTPQALPCPRARNTPHPQRHPESPPPRAITPSRSVGQRRRRGRDVP